MGLCGLPWKILKGSCSKNITDMRSKYSAHLESYTLACHEDPYLTSFDSSLHQRTNRFIRSLSAHDQTQSLSLDSLIDVYGFLSDLHQDAVNVIIESREDVWKNKGLRSLVDVYFNSTSETLDLCNIVENCVKKTEIGKLIIKFAVKQFEEESVDTDLGKSNNKNKFGKTLEELNKFKAMGDPFGGEFLTQYKSVYEQQVLLLEELSKLKVKLDKKERNAKTWRTLSNVVFATAYASALVLSLVLAVMGAPAVATAVATGLTATINEAGKWLNEKWNQS